jgi:O-antigen/teichoic acid export membrane protein
LIGHFLNARQLGIYAVSAAIVAYVPIALQSVNQIFSPTIADLHARREQELLGRVYKSLTKWVLVCTLPLALVLIMFAKPLMRIFGPDFEAGWVVLVIGTVGQLVNCGVGSAGYLLLMSGNERRLIKVQAVGTVVTVGLGLLLVPRWGIVGAAFATCVTMILTNSWNLVQVRRVLGLFPYSKASFLRLLLPTLGATVAVLSSQMLFRNVAPVWVGMGASLFVSYAVFIAISFLSGLDDDDLLIGRAVWSKVKGMLPVAGIGEE